MSKNDMKLMFVPYMFNAEMLKTQICFTSYLSSISYIQDTISHFYPSLQIWSYALANLATLTTSSLLYKIDVICSCSVYDAYGKEA